MRSGSTTPTPAVPMPGGGNVSPVPSPTRVQRGGAGHREVGPTLPGGRPGSRGAAAPPARGEGGTKEMNLSPAMSLVGRVSDFFFYNLQIFKANIKLIVYFFSGKTSTKLTLSKLVFTMC